MTKKHSYTNPEDKFDAAYVEAQVTEGKKYYDEQGWEISPPNSDRECCLLYTSPSPRDRG